MGTGLFITLEGVEGAGKSTALRGMTARLQKLGIEYIVTREPGVTLYAEKIRQLLLLREVEELHPDAELLLYFAGRAQHLARIIRPALSAGKWVICDRFTDATYAYQGYGRGLSLAKISQLETLVQGDLRPDYTLLFDLPPEIGMERVRGTRELDRIEQETTDFFTKVRNGYLEMTKKEPKRYRVINAALSEDEVQKQLTTVMTAILAVVRD